MAKYASFRELIVWQKVAMAAVCYSVALAVAFLGLLPGAWGLILDGFSLFS